jgi:uncharacterized protein
MKNSPLALTLKPAYFPSRAPIDAYGNGGFRFADMSHIGSILCLPSGIYNWEIGDVSEISDLSFSDFKKIIQDADQFDVLLIGTGTEIKPISKTVREQFKEHRVVIEPMSTGAAVRTYNVLLAEERRVACALRAVV